MNSTKCWVFGIVRCEQLDSRSAEAGEYAHNGFSGQEPVVKAESNVNPAISVWLFPREFEDVCGDGIRQDVTRQLARLRVPLSEVWGVRIGKNRTNAGCHGC